MQVTKAQILLIQIAPIIAVILSDSVTDKLYCSPELCRVDNGTDFVSRDHIGCKNNGDLSANCGDDAQLVDINQQRINLILDLHNAARNRVALGKLSGYQSGEAMPVLKWDNELHYLASLNVRRCLFQHDSCRNTDRFMHTGQNIGYYTQSQPFLSVSKRIKLIIGKWFYEYPNASPEIIKAFRQGTQGKDFGHFTTMVSDRVQRVGCAAIRFTSKKPNLEYKFIITCNYDYTNVIGERVYSSGEPASNCTVQPSGRYSGLCDWENDYEDSEESMESADSNSLDIPMLL